MNLDKLTLEEKSKLTYHYPLLLVGGNSSGKTSALENMSAEDKKRTIVLNFDTKPIEEDMSKYAGVFNVGSSKELLEKQIAALPDEAEDYKKHFQKLIATSYFLDDIDAIDKLVKHILKATFSPKIDRIVADTFTSLVDFCEEWSKNHFDSREAWGQYGHSLQRIQQALKEATIFGFKFTYTFAHHEYVDANAYYTTPKKAIAVKGGIMKNNVETAYNTIVYTHQTADGKRMFEVDVDNTFDTSRTKLKNKKFRFERTSLDDLEQYLNGNKKVVNDQLVALDYVAPVVVETEEKK